MFLFGSLECNKKKIEFMRTISMSGKKYYNRMYQKCIYEIAVYTLYFKIDFTYQLSS